MKTALIITERSQQYYWKPFVEACHRDVVDICVFDTSRFPSDSTLTLAINHNGLVDGSLEVFRPQSESAVSKQLKLDDVDIAWYLRPGSPKPSSAMSKLEAEFALDESVRTLDALTAALHCRWINPVEIARRVEGNKFYQQMMACECGLKVPRTVITNDPTTALNLSLKMDGLLIKTLGSTHLGASHDYFVYSQWFNPDEIAASEDAISGCPIFSQEYVEKRFEYRVMMIGEEVLACRIDSQASPATRIDWRHYDFSNVEHKQVELPREVTEKLLNFMRSIGLQYGAIDMIETPNDEFVFLEVNLAGQWQWLHVYAGLPIAEAVADMLETY